MTIEIFNYSMCIGAQRFDVGLVEGFLAVLGSEDDVVKYLVIA
jgi:hypothetical protein